MSRKSAEQRLLDKVVVQPSGCWFFTASVDKRGHGRFRLDGEKTSAHRAAYTLFVGEIPKGAVVRRSCDQPLCVNPDHLVLGWPDDGGDRGRKRRRRLEREREELNRRWQEALWAVDPKVEAFWAQVDVGGDDACWPWLGRSAVVVRGGRVTRPSHYAWEDEHGPLPEGMRVATACGTTGCCNPAHLVAFLRGGLEDRILHYTAFAGPHDCWAWKGAHVQGRNPVIKHKGKVLYVTSLLGAQRFGELPDNARVFHTCGNRRCVNPSHLEARLLAFDTNRGSRADQ